MCVGGAVVAALRVVVVTWRFRSVIERGMRMVHLAGCII